MGFEVRPYKLTWPEGSHWHGLEVLVNGMSIEELGEIAKIKEDGSKDMAERLAPLFEEIKKSLVSWNLTKNGEPVPLSAFLKQDHKMLISILNAWTDVASVDDPLERPSPAGKQLEEVPIPMVIPLESHPSLLMQS